MLNDASATTEIDHEKAVTGLSHDQSNVLLHVSDLCKSYGGHKAVDSVSFDVYRGEVLALVGDNGAGKTTLIKALAGAQPPDSGTITLDGQRLQLDTPRDADDASIGCLHQGLGLVDTECTGECFSWSRVADQVSWHLSAT